MTALVVAVGCIVVVGRTSATSAARLAHLLYLGIVSLSCAAFTFGLLVSSGLVELGGWSRVAFRLFLFRFGLSAGCALAAIGLLMSLRLGNSRSGQSQAAMTFLEGPWVLRALSISTALSFLATEVGKLANLGEMREFFSLAGYSHAFLYFIITAETVGSAFLLVQRHVLLASCCLAILMVGAVHTHYRLGSPPSASFEAIHLLLLLTAIIAIVAWRDWARRRQTPLPVKNPIGATRGNPSHLS